MYNSYCDTRLQKRSERVYWRNELMKVRKGDAELDCVVGGQYQPPGLTLDKDESDEGVSGINVRRFVGEKGGKRLQWRTSCWCCDITVEQLSRSV